MQRNVELQWTTVKLSIVSKEDYHQAQDPHAGTKVNAGTEGPGPEGPGHENRKTEVSTEAGRF